MKRLQTNRESAAIRQFGNRRRLRQIMRKLLQLGLALILVFAAPVAALAGEGAYIAG